MTERNLICNHIFICGGTGKTVPPFFCPGIGAIWQGGIYAVTGVKATPICPENLRPVRAAFIAQAMSGKNYIREMPELDRHPDIDVKFTSAAYQVIQNM